MIKASDYYPFGMPLNEYQARRAHNYRYDYQGQYAEKDNETGWNHFEAREYDPVIGRWMAVDPAREFNSPYVGMGNNPIALSDPDGRSTHTNKKGKVLAVYNDDDLGVYSHSRAEIKVWKKDGGNLGGGELMGSSVHIASFADFGFYENNQDATEFQVGAGARIDFDSKFAQNAVNGILQGMEGKHIGYYAWNARNGKPFDVKHYAQETFGSVYYGSRLHGNVYASARDAGNFAAGIVQQKSWIPNYVISVGFGAYNYSKSIWKGFLLSAEKLLVDPLIPLGAPSSPLRSPNFGEDQGTINAINAGRAFAPHVR